MTFTTRNKLIVAGGLALVAIAGAAWLAVLSRPDPVAALRNRLLGENARGVESVLGSPAYREREDRLWHYVDESATQRFTDGSAAGKELIVEFDETLSVSKVYLEDN